MSENWRELAEGVFVRRHESYDLNVGLVVGAERCLVIDTRMSHRQARDLVSAIRRVTPLPWTVVNTHGHYDHVFGNAVFRPGDIWAHERCAEMVARYGEVQRRIVRSTVGEQTAADLAEVRIDPPDRTFAEATTLDVGGRPVRLRYLGLGHTDNDIVISVPDAGVTFAGDLVEEGAPPAFGDAFPLDWPHTLDRLAAMVTGPVVPGHGDVVDRAFVERQAGELAETARVARQAHREGRRVEEVWARTPFPEPFARDALTRAFRQLTGAPPYDSPEQVLAALDLQ